MKKISIPKKSIYRLLGFNPLVMVSTTDGTSDNVMTLAWITLLDFNPCQLLMVMDPASKSFKNIMKTGEFVVNIVDRTMLPFAVKAGSVSGFQTDKFSLFKIQKSPSRNVSPVSLADAPANLECKLINQPLAKKYGIITGKVVAAQCLPGIFKNNTWNPRHARGNLAHHLGGSSFAISHTVVRL